MDTLISAIDLKDKIPESLHHKCHFAEKIPNDPVPFMASLNFGFKAPDEKQVEHSVIANSLDSLIDQIERAPKCDCDYCKVTLAQLTVSNYTLAWQNDKEVKLTGELKSSLEVLVHFGGEYSRPVNYQAVQDFLSGQTVERRRLIHAAYVLAQDCIIGLAE